MQLSGERQKNKVVYPVPKMVAFQEFFNLQLAFKSGFGCPKNTVYVNAGLKQ